MISKEITVRINEEADARPVAMLVQIASQFRSKVTIQTDNKKINAKSIMGMMALGLISGEAITVVTEGEDEADAAEKMEAYLTGK